MVADAPICPVWLIMLRMAQKEVIKMMAAVSACVLPILLHLFISQAVFRQTLDEFPS